MEDKVAVAHMYEEAEVFQSSILESRQVEHAAEVHAAEERARIYQKQKKVRRCFKVACHERLRDEIDLGSEITCSVQPASCCVMKTLSLIPFLFSSETHRESVV